jgi:hypothetical protein
MEVKEQKINNETLKLMYDNSSGEFRFDHELEMNDVEEYMRNVTQVRKFMLYEL